MIESSEAIQIIRDSMCHMDKYAAGGVAKFFSRLGKLFSAKNALTNPKVYNRMVAEGSHHARMANYKNMLKAKNITKGQYKAYKRQSLQSLDGPGGFWRRWGRNVVDDVSHPMRNAEHFFGGLFKKYVPPSGGASQLMDAFGKPVVGGTMVNKTPWEVTKSVAGAAAFPTLFSAMAWNDPEMSTGGKVMTTAANFAVPVFLRRAVPSLAAFHIIDKAARPKKLPQMQPPPQQPIQQAYQ